MSASPVKPRLHVHRGHVVAVAFWFAPSVLGERGVRGRVLAAWTPGTSVFSLAGGFLLRLPRPRPVDCETAPGLPLTLENGVLLSAPLLAAEQARLAAPPGSLVLVRGGHAEVFPAEPSRRVDVATWLDVSGWTTVSVEGLGAPPPPVQVLESVEKPARSLFQGVPPQAPEAEAMRSRMEGREVPQALQSAKTMGTRGSWWDRLSAWLRGEKGTPVTQAQKTTARAGTASAGGGALSALRRLASWLRRPLGAGGASTGAKAALPPGKGRSTEPAPPPPPEGPGLLSRLSEWLLRNTPLGPLLGQRKAEYVQRLFDMFEEGNLDEALRYAIPLGDDKMPEPTRIALGLPGPRENLAIRPQRGGAASLFGGGQEIYAALRERYRAAFQRLEREGRIDEAAFVLTELLGAHEEAVSFLEKHGRHKLAAELAEGRNLAPGLVVRQWLLAKELRRAVAIARRSGAFADAVLRLMRTQHLAEARTLRLLWAETLAEAGDVLLATVVVWPLEDARPLARGWLEQGVAFGGVGGARALARLLSAFPDSFEAAHRQALALLEDESQDRAAERFAFAGVLASEQHSERRTALVGPLVRALLRDRAAKHTRIDSVLLTRLLRDGSDGTLSADLPALPDSRSRLWADDFQIPLVQERLSATEAGPYPIHDAVALSSQRVLLALGEAGVRLVRADGSCAAHFDVPAFRLVLSVHKDRVLALAPRGELQRISRIELGPRRATHWCDAKVDAFAPSYDGDLWFLAEADTVMAVDALAAEGLRALWRVPQVGGRVVALEADAKSLRFATWGEDPQLWTYTLSEGPTLRSRGARRPGDGLPMVSRDETTGQAVRMDDVLSSPPWTLFNVRTAQGHDVKLTGKGGTERGRFVFEGEARVQARFSGEWLLLFDSTGRLLWVDLTEGTTRRVPVQ